MRSPNPSSAMAFDLPFRFLLVITTLLLTSMFAQASHAQPLSPSLRERGCSDVVVAFSPCLPYVSSPPNNFSLSPSLDCCDLYASAFEGGDADCLCYLIRQPPLLGFPLNSTRLVSLSSLCPLRNAATNVDASLDYLCSRSPKLPPLQSIIGPGIPRPRASGPDDSTPDFMSLPPQSARNSSTAVTSSLLPASPSCAELIHNSSWFLLGFVTFLVQIFIAL